MAQLADSLTRLDAQWARFLRRLLRSVRHHVLSCSSPGRSGRFRQLKPSPPEPRLTVAQEAEARKSPVCSSAEEAADVLSLKISLLGDCHIGKTSFMIKYVGELGEQSGVEMAGLNLMDKILSVKGAKIGFSLWDVGAVDHVPIACKDATAILIMFDLTNRSTLNNAICWYQRARRWNKTAIPILIGTKFDDFVQLPLQMQWTIVNQARACARVMKATLFFSSAIHNINVNKIFKFVAAKWFDLPWTVERNLTIGEPIIDF